MVDQLRERLKAPAVPIQLPIGAEEHFTGIVDLVAMKAVTWDDDSMGMDMTVGEIPAELAEAVGDRLVARAFREVDHRERAARAQPWVRKASSALREKRLDQAEESLSRAESLVPADARVLLLKARLALVREDDEVLQATLAELRTWAPTLAGAVTAENRFRMESGLPLLPERSAEEIGAAGSSSAFDRSR